jgi:hypothetical protein
MVADEGTEVEAAISDEQNPATAGGNTEGLLDML